MSTSAKRYYANCTWFDDGVGDLITYIKEKGLFSNTLFIYVNDNGWEQYPEQEFRHDSMRWHNGGDKGKLGLSDQSFRTPIIFSWPDQIKGGYKKNTLVHSADIPATILDILGDSIPRHWFGKSVKGDIFKTQTKAGGRIRIIGRITQMRSEDNVMGKKSRCQLAKNRFMVFYMEFYR